jgi:AAA+ ATPase superfamily predicted ATPase
MFVGRTEELQGLDSLYAKGGFQLIVVYGRRRIGKTTLLSQFAKKKPTVFFTTQESNDRENLKLFSRALYQHAGLPASTGAFNTWIDAFDFLSDLSAKTPMLLVFDEFPYAAQANKALPSMLQNAIDHKLKNSQLYLVLSGSNIGFMESEVLGHKSPLFGRRTAQMELLPFDYIDASRMMRGASKEDRIRYYACLGGVPYYLSFVDTSLTFEENIISLFFDRLSVFAEEPLMMLRQELREPALYNTILMALAKGANTPQLIADQIGEDRTKVMKYIGTLVRLGFVERRVPFLSNQAKTRKGIYRISDALFAFWFRYLFPIRTEVELGSGPLLARNKVLPVLPEFIGQRFEDVCLQWLRRQNIAGALPFTATTIGTWWGTDPIARQQSDVDVIAADVSGKLLLLGECKWRDSLNASSPLNDLLKKASLFPEFKETWYFLFSKIAFSTTTKRIAHTNNHVSLISLNDLFKPLSPQEPRGL